MSVVRVHLVVAVHRGLEGVEKEVAEVGIAGAVREGADVRVDILACDQEGADTHFAVGMLVRHTVTARFDLEFEADAPDVHGAEAATVAVHAAETVFQLDELYCGHVPLDARGHRVLLDKLDQRSVATSHVRHVVELFFAVIGGVGD